VRTAILLRILLLVLVGILIAGVYSEVAFRYQGNTTSRPPQTVELVIPAGTSAKVAQGQSVLPQDMAFVVGDTLVVRNQDSIAHTLGPLYVPPGTSASLTLNQVGNLAYSCSFQPTQYLGLDVQDALTLGTRLEGILIAGVPMGVLMGLYSLIVWPIKRADKTPETPA
jgi:hypothetical protein